MHPRFLAKLCDAWNSVVMDHGTAVAVDRYRSVLSPSEFKQLAKALPAHNLKRRTERNTNNDN